MRQGRHWVLDGMIPRRAELREWARWYETAERHVADTESDGIRVSTVFLGLDHQYGDGPPLLFETMVFGGEHDEDCERYSTWEEAETGHRLTCERVGIAHALPSEAD